jgi:hypothetical protein
MADDIAGTPTLGDVRRCRPRVGDAGEERGDDRGAPEEVDGIGEEVGIAAILRAARKREPVAAGAVPVLTLTVRESSYGDSDG